MKSSRDFVTAREVLVTKANMLSSVDPNLLLLRQRAALTQPQIHGDERDGIIAKLNQLQAYWGTGKGFFSQQEAVDFTPENQFCRFKVYSACCNTMYTLFLVTVCLPITVITITVPHTVNSL